MFQVITLVFNKDFQIGLLTNCDHYKRDYIEVYDGSDDNAPLLGKYCGTSAPADPIPSTGAHLYLHFYSSPENAYNGANFTWTSQLGE